MKIAHNSKELVKYLSKLKEGEEIFLIESLDSCGLPQKYTSKDEFMRIQKVLQQMRILQRHRDICWEFNHLNYGKLSLNQIRIYKTSEEKQDE